MVADARMRLVDLALWIFDEFRISLDESTVSRELNALGFSKITARPNHRGQNEFVVGAFIKTSSLSRKRSAPGSRSAPR